jgi:O-antigen/teichoic acid export membrane protein
LIGYFSTSYLDAIFISQYLTKKELGIYSVAYQINGILMQFPVLAGSLLMPLFVTLQSNKQDETVKKYITDVLPLITLIWGFACVSVAIIGMFFIPIIFGPEVAESSGILWILVISSVIAAPSLFGYVPYINAVSATYIGTLMAVVSAFVNVLANYFLIPKYGLVGCAWATVLAYLASFLLVLIICHRQFPPAYRWTFQAILPAIICCYCYAVTGQLGLALALLIICSAILILFYRKSIVKALAIISKFSRLSVN